MKDLKIVFYILFLFCFSNLLDAQSESAIRNSLGTKLQIEQPELITWTTTSSHYDPISDLTHIYARQTYNGLPIVGSESDFHINGKNGVVASNVLFKENYALKMSPNFSIMKEMEHTELLHNIVDQLELPRQKLQINVVSQNLNNKTSILRAEGIANGDIPFKGVLFYEKNNQLQYGYLVKIDVSSSPDWWEILVNAKNGNIISKVNYTISCAPEGLDNIDRKKRKLSVSATHSPSHSHADIENAHAIMVNAQDCYLVYPSPLESPYNGPQSMTTDPANNTASPFGWHDTNGTIGHEFTITRGNNVWAKEDLNGDNEGTIGFSPDGGANLVFNFPIDLLIEPSQYQAGAITNLFYWNNLIHDVMHFYGFDEASGNFQQTNYSGQGTGGDYVNADAQNSGNCNANFATPPDGSRPRMQMFTCSNAVPKRDSDLDNGVLVHEYGHGISNRLTGGAGNSSCLNNAEQMGEGWSDFFGMMMTMELGDMGTDSRGMGNYFTGRPANGGGIRPFPYSTDLGINPMTYNQIKSVSVPHGVGSVWATMLWEMTWGLIEKHGFDADLYQGSGGNNIALKLVMQGLKLQPCRPGFIDGRDAILQADTILFGGVNSCIIWNAFAKRGLGISADQGLNTNVQDGVEAFDIPVGVPSFCLDDSDFFAVASPKLAKECDTFAFEVFFYTNTAFPNLVSLTSQGLQDTAIVNISNITFTVPNQIQIEIIDTIGLPALDTFSLPIIANNGSETDTILLKISKYVPPQAIVLTNPNDAGIFQSSPINMKWNGDSDAQFYQLQIAPDMTFFTLALDTILTVTSFDYINNSTSDFQFWRVRGINNCNIGTYSSIRSFAHRLCGTQFLDPGGENNYLHNLDTLIVLCPDNDTTSIFLDFLEFSIFENSESCQWDRLEVYQGDSRNNSKLIGIFCEDDLASLPNGGDIFSTDPTGCLTFFFHTSSVNTATGWKADLSCVECPPVQIEDIVILDATCIDTADGSVTITVPPLKLEYTYKLIKGIDTISNTTGVFSDVKSGTYSLVVFPTHFPECEGNDSNPVIIGLNSMAILDIIDGCVFDSSSVLTVDFPCGSTNFHTYLLPDSIVSLSHIYTKLPTGNYRVIIEDTANHIIVIDSTVQIAPHFVNAPQEDTVMMHTSESHMYEGYISTCMGAGQQTVYTNNTRIAINDLDTSKSSINVISSTIPDEMRIHFIITHTWVGDLGIFLKSPSGQEFPLFANPSNCRNDNINITTSDTSTQSSADFYTTCNTSFTGLGVPGPPYAKEGSFKGQTELNTMMAGGVNGEWTLKIYDGFNLDQGFIEEFSIFFEYNKSTNWYSDVNGNNLIHTGDTINPFDNSLSLLNIGITDTLVIYEACVNGQCRSELSPITFFIHDNNAELLFSMNDCGVDRLLVTNSNLGIFPSNQEIKVNDQLNATVLIDNTMNIKMTAGNVIELLSGFEVELNAVFEADIEPCIKQ